MKEMSESPLISVVIPSYNAAAYIEQAVSSALASSGVAVEVIVVDDGSSDDTWQRLEKFGPRIVRLQQERGGAYRARNLAASLAKGEWLAFLDADDDWMPGKLAAQLALADENTAIVYTDRLNFGDITRVKERQSDSVTLYEGDVFEPLLKGNFITLSSVIMRKSWFEKMGGFAVERRGVQDWDMWLRSAASGGVVRLCGEPLTRYRLHAGQMSNDLDQRAADREAVLKRALDSPRGKLVSMRVKRQALAGLWVLAGEHSKAAGLKKRAILEFLLAWSYWPWQTRACKEVIKCILGRN